jgi:nucleotide-binding universal stress UspA family protein
MPLLRPGARWLLIIVGVDFSAGSAVAATVARQMAAERGTASSLVHVRGALDSAREHEEMSDEWLDGLGLTRGDVEVRKGVPWVELVRAAGEREATLLVAGTHGRSGFQPLRLGKTAELIALRSPTPVVLVPPIQTAEAMTTSRSHTKISEEGE